MNLQDVTNAVSIVESVAVLVAAVAATLGISAWRREHVGRKRIDTAEEILELFYLARDAFADVRSSFGFAGEGGSRKREENEREEESKALDQAYVAIERYRRYKDEFAKLRALRYRALAYWGTASVVPFDTFDQISKRIMIAARMLPHYWSGRTRDEGNRRRKLEADFWSGDEKDELTLLADKMVEQAESLFKPVITGEGNPRQPQTAPITPEKGS